MLRCGQYIHKQTRQQGNLFKFNLTIRPLTLDTTRSVQAATATSLQSYTSSESLRRGYSWGEYMKELSQSGNKSIQGLALSYDTADCDFLSALFVLFLRVWFFLKVIVLLRMSFF